MPLGGSSEALRAKVSLTLVSAFLSVSAYRFVVGGCSIYFSVSFGVFSVKMFHTRCRVQTLYRCPSLTLDRGVRARVGEDIAFVVLEE